MPFFATGLHYSETGNALEGMQTPSFAATTGIPSISLFLVTLTDSLRLLLRHVDRSHLRIPDLLHPNKHLPVRGPLTACDYLRLYCWLILPACIGQ